MKRIIIFLTISLAMWPFGSIQAKTPNDPHVSQWSYDDIGVYKAWDYTTGSSDVVVAIIDNGFDSFHPELKDNLWWNEGEIRDNNIDDDGNGYIDDVNGWNFVDDNNDPRPHVNNLTDEEKSSGIFNHGTVVAGIIGAKGNNGVGGVGLNWNVKLMNLKVIGNSGYGDLEPMVDAIYYAVDNGADVINISMVGDIEYPSMIEDAIDYAYQNNVLVVAAAGNNLVDLNISKFYPVCSDANFSTEEVLGVSATDKDRHLAFFSNTGSECVDITAPGVEIYSTVRFSPKDGLTEYYGSEAWSGTSFAAPFISGTAALLRSINRDISAAGIIDVILKTVHHTPGQDEDVYANLFGAGLLQVDKAIEYFVNHPDEQPVIDNSSQVAKFAKLKNVFIDPRTGSYERRTSAYGTTGKGSEEIFKQAEDMMMYEYDNQKALYILATDADNHKIVKIYNDTLELQRTVQTDLQGIFKLTVGNMSGDEQPEIVLSPQFASTTYFYTYNVDSQFITSYAGKTTYQGTNVVFHNDEIALLLRDSSQSYIQILDTSFDVQREFNFSNIIADKLVVFDIDNDGEDEYILGAIAGRQAFIREYSSIDGSEEFVNRAYPSFMKQGFDFTLIDINNDGYYEYLITPNAVGAPVRIMDVNNNLLNSWWPFDSQDTSGVLFLQPGNHKGILE